MTKSKFRSLLMEALDRAAACTEARLARPIPRSFLIELHGAGSPGQTVSIDAALNRLYLGSDRFYRIIDVAIKKLLPRKSVAFVRVSGHSPTNFDETWNPADLGPFKQIIGETIEDQHIVAP
jgi:hypothetical protein